MRTLPTLGVASGIGGNRPDCVNAAVLLRKSDAFYRKLNQSGIRLDWEQILFAKAGLTAERTVAGICTAAARWSQKKVCMGQPFLALGGDHSTAIGLWKGAMRGLHPHKSMGLIWLDAHMDMHTFSSSPSGNIHGMPLAALLGLNDPRLQRICGNAPHLLARNLAMLGMQAFEPEERLRVSRLHPFYVDRIHLGSETSLRTAIADAVNRITGNADGYGISLDLDVIDTEQAPGVATPEPGGLDAKDVCRALSTLRHDSRLIGLEIAEYCPKLDREQRTMKTIADLVCAVYGPPRTPKRFFGSAGAGNKSVSVPVPSSSARS